jgi:quercetin dioxygenase-like cupin family protein
MEIRRFGIGHRRHDGPPGTRGAEATPVHVDELGSIAELLLKPSAAIAPHSNPNLTYFLVIEGGGFVQVGDEKARVASGDAVVWPPNIVHAAWTELTPMRAIVVEFAGGDNNRDGGRGGAREGKPLLLEGSATAPKAGPDPAPADGALAPRPIREPSRHTSAEEEPW